MRIDLITRVQFKDLYEQMYKSALGCSEGIIGMLFEKDKERLPRLAFTYNRLAKKSKADILCFVHDDIKFLTHGWDTTIKRIFRDYKPDILGVCGATEYWGIQVFDAGHPYLRGVIAGEDHDNHREFVRILSPFKEYERAKVVDGSIMFVSRKYWEKNRFDEKTFDQLFFYDIDLCLRSENVGITTSVVVKHYKDLYRYDYNNYKPISHYWNDLKRKHNLRPRMAGDSRCCMVDLKEYYTKDHNKIYNEFKHEHPNILI